MESNRRQTLSQMPRGVPATVEEIEGDDLIATRLLEMGLTPGATAVVVGAALSGDPIEIRLRQYRLSLRLSEADRVIVRQPADDQTT